MSYLYLIVIVMAFALISNTVRRRLFKPVDKATADAELEERLRSIEDERGERRR